MTVDAVAARASKQTIYRRWPPRPTWSWLPSRAPSSTCPPPQDTGSLRDDLLALLDSLLNELAELGDIIAGLLAELRRNPELATAMHRGYSNTRRQAALDVFTRARARGELTSDVDLGLLWQLAPATLFSACCWPTNPSTAS